MKKIITIVLVLLMFFVNFRVNAEFPREYNPEDLSDYFSTMQACDHEGGSNDCKNGNEYKSYVKMYDIYYLYKNKYNVQLDLPLIMAALYYGNEELPIVYKKNLNEYNRSHLKKDDFVTNLDWEFDYKNYDCYTYLNSNDFRFDMQILAKNMVKKETTYTCVVESDDEEEEESEEETHTVEDIETSNYSTETLPCDEGEYDSDTIEVVYQDEESDSFEHVETKIEDGVVRINDDYVWDGRFRYLNDDGHLGRTDQELRDAADIAYEGYSRLYLGLED